jgi:large subunit ribosomal protein L29
MKTKDKIKDFQKMSGQELKNLLQNKKERLRELRFDLIAGKVKNVREIREIKKDIARLNTILRASQS